MPIKKGYVRGDDGVYRRGGAPRRAKPKEEPPKRLKLTENEHAESEKPEGAKRETLDQRFERFLVVLGETGEVGDALDATGLSLPAVTHRRKRSADFDAGWELAMERSGKAKAHLVFLDVFSKTGNQTEALRLAGMRRATLLALKRDDPGFAEMFEEAQAESADALEAEARRRAVHGVEDLVIWGGGPVYHRDANNKIVCDEIGQPIPVTRKVFSDRLLETLLKANNREKFGENVKVDHAVTGGVLLLAGKAPSADEWEQRMAQKRAERAGRVIEHDPQSK